MKIFWFHSHFYNWMGGTKFVLEIVKRIKEKCDIDIVVQNGDDKVIERFEKVGVKVHNLKSLSSNSPKFWLGFYKYCNEDAKKLQKLIDENNVDVVMSSMFPTNYIASKVSGVKIYQYAYEPFAYFWDAKLLKTLPVAKKIISIVLAFLYGKYDKLATSMARKTFTLSELTAKQMMDVYGVKSIPTYEGVDLSFYKHKESKEIFDKYKNNTVFLHNTDFTFIKRTDLTFKIFIEIKKEIPNAKLLITNTISVETEMERMKQIAKTGGLKEDDYEFLGFVDYELLPVYYSVATMTIVSAINLPQSLPVKESLACGTPVARSWEEEAEYEDSDNMGVLIDTYDAKASARKMIDFLNSKKFDEKNARKYVEEKFNWDKIAELIVNEIK